MYRLFPALFFVIGCTGDEPTALVESDTDTDTDTDTDADADTMDVPEIAGTYVDDFGSDQVVGETTWTSYGTDVFNYTLVDNNNDLLVAINDDDNGFMPGAFSRFNWHDDGAALWYCQSVYDAATEADALAAPAPDTTDPSTSGCGGFSWSMLIAP